MTDIKQLLKQCLNGYAPAQKQLYTLYVAQMFGVCIRYTKSIDDAQDILQEGFIKAFNNLQQFKNSGEFGAWLRRIMVNTALTYLKRKKNYSLDMVMDNEHMHPVSNDNPIIDLQVKEIVSLIKQLPTGFQTIFNLHAIEGYTHVEIAAMLGISEGTSRSQYMRARNILTGWIKNFNGDKKIVIYA